jgi:hypothetical protein
MKKPTSATFQPSRLFLLFVCGMTVGAHAQGLLIDQSLQPPPIIPGESYHYDASGATLMPETGQEFTPSLSGLDFVDVNLLPQSVTNTGTFEVAIHQGEITAPVLGLSGQVIRSGGTAGNNTHFTFPSTISLTQGDTYVLEVLQIAGNSGWAVEVPVSAVVNGQTVDMNYAGGRLIYGGVPQATEDMIFQEGIIVPATSAILTISALGDGNLQIIASGPTGPFTHGIGCVLQSATNLVDWTVINTNIFPIDGMVTNIVQTTNLETFYRVEVLQ